jgi:RND family efflux transporter MFP subunit
MKRKVISIIVIVILAVGGIAVVKRKQKEITGLPMPAQHPMAVQTAPVSKGSLEVLSHQIGEIQPYASADIAPRITGHIISINKREGDFVKKGEVLCVIDDREMVARAGAIQAEASAARARLAGAKSVYETQRAITDRDEKLFTAGAISKEALERSQAALGSAKSSVDAYEENIKGLEKNTDAARLQSEYAKVTAPFSGVITKRLAEPGDLAVPGKPVLAMEQKTPVKVVAQVPQELIKKLRPGVKVYISDGTDRIHTTITRVYPAMGKNFMGSIEMVFKQSPFGLPTGATVGIDIVTVVASGIIVPENAIARTGKGYFIYQLENNNTIRVRQVEFLGSERGKAAIKVGGDLPEGSLVAVGQENRLLTLTDGAKVGIGEKR